MAHRTALLVMVTALALLVASFSLQSNSAYAHDTNEASIAEIYAIKDAAIADIDSAVASATSQIAAAGAESEAAAIRDDRIDDVEGIAWTAGGAMWWVAEDAHWSVPVQEAFWDAVGIIQWRATQASGEIWALYDGWVDENSGPTPTEVIAGIDQKLSTGLDKIADIVGGFENELDSADDTSEAGARRDGALGDLDDRVAITLNRLGDQLELLPDDPAVQAAYGSAVEELHEAADAAAATINSQYEQWVNGENPAPPPTTTTLPPTTTTTIALPTTTTFPPTTTTTITLPTTTTTLNLPPTTVTVPPQTTTTTTTTTVPPTTSTVAPTTTTTVSPTTTTTLAPAALLPDLPPPGDQRSFMAGMPDPVVLSSTAASSSQELEKGSMAAVALVRRVVESQLPAGVSTVAAGPLIVLGLVLDAIRAAGALMAVPWLVLAVYMVGLLRQHGQWRLGVKAGVS